MEEEVQAEEVARNHLKDLIDTLNKEDLEEKEMDKLAYHGIINHVLATKYVSWFLELLHRSESSPSGDRCVCSLPNIVCHMILQALQSTDGWRPVDRRTEGEDCD